MVVGHPLPRVEEALGRGGGTTAACLDAPPPAAPAATAEEEFAMALATALAAASRTVRSAQCCAAATTRAKSGCKSPPSTRRWAARRARRAMALMASTAESAKTSSEGEALSDAAKSIASWNRGGGWTAVTTATLPSPGARRRPFPLQQMKSCLRHSQRRHQQLRETGFVSHQPCRRRRSRELRRGVNHLVGSRLRVGRGVVRQRRRASSSRTHRDVCGCRWHGRGVST